MDKIEFEVLDETIVMKVKAFGESPLTKLGEESSTDLTRKLRGVIEMGLLHRFIADRRAGRIIEATSLDRRNNKFVRDGGWLSEKGHNFIHKARLDLLHLNANIGNSSGGDKTCRRCGSENETLIHVLQSCKYHLGTGITNRHDGVLNRIKHAVAEGGKSHWNARYDLTLEMSNGLRPDIVLENPKRKELIISDVCVPFELGNIALENAREHKISKYTPLAERYIRKGYKVTLEPIVVGSLGSWRRQNDVALKALGIRKGYRETMVELIIAKVIEDSKNIYWKHVFGEKFQTYREFLPVIVKDSVNGSSKERPATLYDEL